MYCPLRTIYFWIAHQAFYYNALPYRKPCSIISRRCGWRCLFLFIRIRRLGNDLYGMSRIRHSLVVWQDCFSSRILLKRILTLLKSHSISLCWFLFFFQWFIRCIGVFFHRFRSDRRPRRTLLRALNWFLLLFQYIVRLFRMFCHRFRGDRRPRRTLLRSLNRFLLFFQYIVRLFGMFCHRFRGDRCPRRTLLLFWFTWSLNNSLIYSWLSLLCSRTSPSYFHLTCDGNLFFGALLLQNSSFLSVCLRLSNLCCLWSSIGLRFGFFRCLCSCNLEFASFKLRH